MTNIQAIDLLKGLEQSLDDYCELNDEGKTAFRMAITALEVFGISEQLPSAQPETYKEKLNEIASALSEKFAYMNTCLNERDIILGYLGVKRSCEIHCNTNCTNTKCESHPSFAQSEQRWIPVSERLPEKPNIYTVTDSKGDVVRFVFYDTESSREYWLRCAKAWMPLPTPYREGEEK